MGKHEKQSFKDSYTGHLNRLITTDIDKVFKAKVMNKFQQYFLQKAKQAKRKKNRVYFENTKAIQTRDLT